jgi:hypothetical protein
MIVHNFVIPISGAAKTQTAPAVAAYPREGATNAYPDAVPKLFFSRPVRGVTSESFTLTDSRGTAVPADVDQIGDGVWGLFPHAVLLMPGEKYTARLRRGICDLAGGGCTSSDLAWSFRVSPEGAQPTGDTSVPIAFTLDPKTNKYTSEK